MPKPLLIRAALLGVVCCFAWSAQAQRRIVNNLVLLPEMQAEVALQGDDYLFGAVNLLYPNDGLASRTFSQRQLRLGYEHFWNERWSWGATARVTGLKSGFDGKLETELLPELLLRHWNTYGNGLNFRQRLGLLYLIPPGEAENRALTSLRLDVDKVFALGSRWALRPRLAAEGVAYLRLQREEDEPKERFLDFTYLRAELGCRVSPHFDFTPYFSYQQVHVFGLEQRDMTGQIVVPAGPLNLVTPVVGLEARLTLTPGGFRPDRRQLPTQR